MVAAVVCFRVALACASSFGFTAGTLCGGASSFAATFDVALATSQAIVFHGLSDRDLRHSWPMSVFNLVQIDLARSHGIFVDEISSKKGGVQETSKNSNLVEYFVSSSFVVHDYTRYSTLT